MSVQWVIPNQARFISTVSVFVGTFNVPVLGAYGFSIPANAGVLVLPLQPNTQYLLERVTIGADISELDYSAALDLSAVDRLPRLRLIRRSDGSGVYESSIPVPAFVRQNENSVWVKSDSDNDALLATFTGQLSQTAALVGVPAVRVTVSYSVYAIESTIYNRAFRGSQSLDLADSVRRS